MIRPTRTEVPPPAIAKAPPLDAEISAARDGGTGGSPATIAAAALAKEQDEHRVVAEFARGLRLAAGSSGVTDDDLKMGGIYEPTEVLVPGLNGAPEVSLLICHPVADAAARPALYFVHGGGMVSGTNRTAVLMALDLAAEVDAVLVSVEYRLAPEHAAPAQVEDCYAGLLGLAELAEEFHIDLDAVVVMGGSAGGAFAAALCLMASDHGGPKIAALLLAAPMLDVRNTTWSVHQMVGHDIWDSSCNRLAWAAILPSYADRGGIGPYDSPALSADLSVLPPTLIDVGSAETLRDEAVSFASRIWASGGIAELHVWPGGSHGYELIARTTLARLASASRKQWLRRLLDH